MDGDSGGGVGEPVVSRLWVQQYRSLVDLQLDLRPGVTVIQGENATGKTNLYRVLLLLSRGAGGMLAQTLLEEGGLPSALWAGTRPPSRTRRPPPVRLRLGVTVAGLSYELALGWPDAASLFSLDAEIKEEAAWVGAKRNRHSEILDRAGSTATAQDADGKTVTYAVMLDRFETAIAQLGEPKRFLELYALRERMRRWRFYHQIPTGLDAPARAPRPSVRTPVLADDGRDLAAALATIDDMGGGVALHNAIDDAFNGATLAITADGGTFELGLDLPGLYRLMTGRELSDGTLRYLSLIAALLSPRPPDLLVLNEPETSLHGSLIAPLARLIADAATRTQLVVTTHSTELASALADATGSPPIVLQRRNGATCISPVTRSARRR